MAEVGQLNQDEYNDMPALVDDNQENSNNIPALVNNQDDDDDMPALIGINQENSNNMPALVNNQDDDDMPALIGVNQENYDYISNFVNNQPDLDDMPALIDGNQDIYIINYIVPQILPVIDEKPIYINSDTYDKSEICEIIYNNETIKLIFNSTYSPEYGYEMQLSMDYTNADSHNIVYFSQGALATFEKYARVYEKVVYICIGDNKYIISAKLLLNNADDHGYESINISGTFISCIPDSDLYKLCGKVLYHTQPFYYYV
jgi:hypothetical protein